MGYDEQGMGRITQAAAAIPLEQRRRAADIVVRYAHHDADRDELLAMLNLPHPHEHDPHDHDVGGAGPEQP